MCLQCTSNDALPFENPFTIQLPDCTNLLVEKAGLLFSKSISFVEAGPDLEMNYLEFFNETPITGCSSSCIYGNSCSISGISSPYVVLTALPNNIKYS